MHIFFVLPTSHTCFSYIFLQNMKSILHEREISLNMTIDKTIVHQGPHRDDRLFALKTRLICYVPMGIAKPSLINQRYFFHNREKNLQLTLVIT